MGHMDVMHGHLVLFSVPVMIADFSGDPEHCSPRGLVWASPREGCQTLPGVDYTGHENKYVLADRGGCSFSAKGANAESVSAAGLIIVNGEDRLVDMPPDPTLLSKNLDVPVVMIAKKAADEIDSSLAGHGGGVSARLAITAACLKKDAAFHRKYSEAHEREVLEEEEGQRRAVNEARSRVNARGVRAGPAGEVGGVAASPAVDSNEVLSDYAASHRSTKREIMPARAAELLREEEGIRSGEMLVKVAGEPQWEIEYLAVSVGGYLPREGDLSVVAVSPSDVVDCRTPGPALERVVVKARKDRAVLWRAGGRAGEGERGECKEWELVALAHRLRADVLLLYDAGSGDAGSGEGGTASDDFVPMEAEAAEIEIEYATHLDPEFNAVVEEEFKTAVVAISVAAARLLTSGMNARESEAQTVAFRADNFVALAWEDIGRLRDGKSWPQSRVQRDRLLRRMTKVHGKYEERMAVIRTAHGEAERFWEREGGGEEAGSGRGGEGARNSAREEL